MTSSDQTVIASTTAGPATRSKSKTARALARARREALYADRAARDRRIDEQTALAIDGLAAHAKLNAAEEKVMAQVGRTLNRLLTEGLARAEVAALTDLTDTQIRRYQAAAAAELPTSPSQAGGVGEMSGED